MYAARRHFERKNIPVDDDDFERSAPSPTPSVLSIVSEEDCSDDSNLVNVSKAVSVDEGSASSQRCNSSPDSQPQQYETNLAKRHRLSLLHRPQSKDLDQAIMVNMRDICGIVACTVQAHQGAEFPLFKLRTVYDGLETVSNHLHHSRHSQALKVYEEVQNTYARMFAMSDPWVLAALIHCLFDFVCHEQATPTIVSFLQYMFQLASRASKNHPIATLIRTFLNGYRCSPGSVNTIFQVCSDVLENGVGRSYSLSFCVNRMRAYALDHFGLLEDAERLLSEELAFIAEDYGAVSQQNLSRLLSLAGCLYQKGDYFGAIVRVDEFWGLVNNKKIPDDRLLSIAYFGGLNEDERLDIAQDTAVCIRAWLLQFKAVGKHINHANRLVNWLERGAPMSG